MNSIHVFIVVAILILVVGLAVAFLYYRKRRVDQFFSQVYEQIKQVPKQKKNSFLLLLFKESLSASKNKASASSFSSKFQNPKYLEIQLVQMSNILKDSSKVQDKVIKKSLNLLTHYQAWEKIKLANDKKSTENKAS